MTRINGLIFCLSSIALPAVMSGCAKPPPLTQIEQTIFTRSCQFSSCHAGGNPASGLSLMAPTYQQLVNAKSFEAPSRTRVIPGDPDNSYLIEKLTSATPTVGQRMPPNNDPLPDDELSEIRDWILGGAQNN